MSLLDMSEAKLSRDSFTFNIVGASDLDTLWFAIDYGLAHERFLKRLSLKRLARTIHRDRPRGEDPKLLLQGEPAITAVAALRRVAWDEGVTAAGMRTKANDLLDRAYPGPKAVIVRALQQRLPEDRELRKCVHERSMATIALEALAEAGFVVERRNA